MTKSLSSFIVFCLAFILTACNSSDEIANMSANELAFQFPHLFDAPPPQEFAINTEKDTVIFGASGTLLAIEAGTFADEKGNALKGNLTLSLREALSLSQMIEHKLTTQTTDGHILQSGGMIQLTAKTDKKEKINILKSIHAEIPTLKKDGNMSVYEGIQASENAPVRWKKEKELENWLTEIPLEKLNFFPDDKNIAINYNQSKNVYRFVQDFDSLVQEELPETCGISKYILEGLSNKKFQGTFVSTYEFERRVKAMNECCGNDLIAIYLKNLNKNLWESDQAAADYLTKNKKCKAYVFEDFVKEKATKVKPKGKVNRALKKYIERLFRDKERAWEKFRKNYDRWEEKRQGLQADITEKMENERRFAERLSYSFDLNKFG